MTVEEVTKKSKMTKFRLKEDHPILGQAGKTIDYYTLLITPYYLWHLYEECDGKKESTAPHAVALKPLELNSG